MLTVLSEYYIFFLRWLCIDDGCSVNFPICLFSYRSPQFCDTVVRVFDRRGARNINFDDFIQTCVMLKTLTDKFRVKDSQQQGVINISYEDVRAFFVFLLNSCIWLEFHVDQQYQKVCSKDYVPYTMNWYKILGYDIASSVDRLLLKSLLQSNFF